MCRLLYSLQQPVATVASPSIVDTWHHLCCLLAPFRVALRLDPVPELGRLLLLAAPTVNFELLLGTGKPND